MSNTKENILQAALRLFARDGYEAVSVSMIAGELSMTKGALYKHYKNKRDIFDKIVERIYQMDAANAAKNKVPEETFDRSPTAYQNTALEDIVKFTLEQFDFWTRNEFASNFRKMLTLEQYRNTEMTELYQKCLVSGPVSYTEDLFREMMSNGTMPKKDSKLLAIEFYAPLYLLISISDAMPNKIEAAALLKARLEDFIRERKLPKENKK